MTLHDPERFASNLGAKLATRSRHVCALLGAGASRACGLPDVTQLQVGVLKRLEQDQREALSSQLTGRNLEQVLSRLRRIVALLAKDEQTIDDLTSAQAKALDGATCQAIVEELGIGNANLEPMAGLAAWAARSNYHSPLELFTVNYDLLLEAALESLCVPYFDGFIGSLRAQFQTELVESMPGDPLWVPTYFVRLWKLHGSVNWARESDGTIVRSGQDVEGGRVAAIYPSDTKYEESRRVPFVVLQDRLRRALRQPETLMLIAGYSFSDSHLSEMLFDAASRHERSELIAFCYSEIPEELAERAATTPNLQAVSSTEAIVGGVRGEWAAPEEPRPSIWSGDEFLLPDFKHLASFLSRSMPNESLGLVGQEPPSDNVRDE
jgi:SIR2-like domain